MVQESGTTSEMEINDYSPEIRALLTRGATHEQVSTLTNITAWFNVAKIRNETGATILSRGLYQVPGTQSNDRPLYLLISGENTVVVEKAKEKLQEIINKAVRGGLFCLINNYLQLNTANSIDYKSLYWLREHTPWVRTYCTIIGKTRQLCKIH